MKKRELMQWILSLSALVSGYAITYHSPCASGSFGVFAVFAVSALCFSPLPRYIAPRISSPSFVAVQIVAAVFMYGVAMYYTYPYCRGTVIPFVNENARISYWEQKGSTGNDDHTAGNARTGFIEEDSETAGRNAAEPVPVDRGNEDTVSSSAERDNGTYIRQSAYKGKDHSVSREGSTSSWFHEAQRAASGDREYTRTGKNRVSPVSDRSGENDSVTPRGAEVRNRFAGNTGNDISRNSTGQHVNRRVSGRSSTEKKGPAVSRRLPDGRRYSGTTRRDIPEGKGEMKWPDGSRYTGQWKDGKRNGRGTMRYSAVSRKRISTGTRESRKSRMNPWRYDMRRNAVAYVILYSGIWQKDVPFRKGTFRWNTGDYYRGRFVNAQRHGYGIYRYKHGTVYRGNWRYNKAHGKGRIRWKNGDRYNGDWRNDRREGYGTYVWRRGIRYSGTWHNNMMHGNGAITWANGNRYSGQWKRNHRNGHGKYIWKSGDRYEGAFANDKRNGNGTYVWTDGKKYSGSWKNGLMEGQGVLRYPDGKTVKGTFKRNTYTGR